MTEVLAYVGLCLYVLMGAIIGAIGGTSVAKTICRIGGAILFMILGALAGILRSSTNCVNAVDSNQIQDIDLILCVVPGMTVGIILALIFSFLHGMSIAKLLNMKEETVTVVLSAVGGALGGYGTVTSGIDPLNLIQDISVISPSFAFVGMFAGAIVGIIKSVGDLEDDNAATNTIETAKSQALEDAIEAIRLLAETSNLNVAAGEWHRLQELCAPAGYVFVQKAQKWLVLREFRLIQLCKPESKIVVFGSGRAEYQGNEVIAILKTSNAELLENHLYKRFARRHQRGEWFGLRDFEVEEIRRM